MFKDPRKYPKNWILDGCKGRDPRMIRSLLLGEGALERFNEKLQAKYKEIKDKEVRCEILYGDDSDIILVGYGITSRGPSFARFGRLSVRMLKFSFAAMISFSVSPVAAATSLSVNR